MEEAEDNATTIDELPILTIEQLTIEDMNKPVTECPEITREASQKECPGGRLSHQEADPEYELSLKDTASS